jgi:hypothetical protein
MVYNSGKRKVFIEDFGFVGLGVTGRGVRGLELRVWGLKFEVWDLGFGV